jgi:hypothetical protein
VWHALALRFVRGLGRPSRWTASLRQAWNDASRSVAPFVSKLLGFIVILVIGVDIAKAGRWVPPGGDFDGFGDMAT